MLELYPDHCEVVKESLSGARSVDEQTLASVAVLNERLQRVKKMGQKFSIVEFSPAVKKLKSHSNKVVAV
jgi:anti-anti-sigma regulatory factor